MRTHECWKRGCHVLCRPGHDYCPKHEAEHQQERFAALKRFKQSKAYQQYNKNRYRKYNAEQRDPEANAFYQSNRWSKTREFIKARDMMIDGATGRVLADHDYIVDHIVPRRLCKDPFDPANLWLLSRKEHYRKTQIKERIANQSNGDNKLRHIDKKIWIKWLNEKQKN